MSETILRNQRIWIDTLQIAGAANSVALSLESAELDRTTLEDTARRRRGGLYDHTIGIDGYADKATIEAALFAEVGLADRTIVITAPDAAEDGIAYAAKCFAGSFTPLDGAVGDLGAFSLSASADGKIVRGALAFNRTITADAPFANVVELNSVESGRKLYAILIVSGFDVDDELDVTVNSSASAGLPSTTLRITFPTITADGVYWQEWGGETSHAFFVSSFDVEGSSPSIAATLVLAVV